MAELKPIHEYQYRKEQHEKNKQKYLLEEIVRTQNFKMCRSRKRNLHFEGYGKEDM